MDFNNHFPDDFIVIEGCGAVLIVKSAHNRLPFRFFQFPLIPNLLIQQLFKCSDVDSTSQYGYLSDRDPPGVRLASGVPKVIRLRQKPRPLMPRYRGPTGSVVVIRLLSSPVLNIVHNEPKELAKPTVRSDGRKEHKFCLRMRQEGRKLFWRK